MRKLVFFPVIAWSVTAGWAADLPIKDVILYKHGVGFFERGGKLEAGDTARIDFKADDMNDVLKSLTITDRSGGKISGVRYDASEPLEERLKNFPFAVGTGSTLAVFLDQMKGARIELKQYRAGVIEAMEGVIVSARVAKAGEKEADVETITLLTDAGELRTFSLPANSIRFADPKLQGLLKDYLAVLNGARSKDRRSVYIDSIGSAARDLVASYMTPSPVWKSSYRLLFPQQGEPTLEGWAIVDNTSGDDWNSVKLSVISGRPISFITQLYAPKYVEREEADLEDNVAAKPRVFQGSITAGAIGGMVAAAKSPPAPMAKSMNGAAGLGGRERASFRAEASDQIVSLNSSISSTAEGRDAGDLFEYSFSSPVTVKKGESAMLPFLQQKLGARKLLIYEESFGVNPQNATELTNSTGKTLDGGPITVYDGGTYAGEALVETVKAGDKRLISYGVDLGTRITTKFDSSKNVVREIHYRRGMLTSKYAMEELKTFTIKNVDPKAKTLIIEHPERPGYKLLEPEKATETTANAYRFEVKLAASAADTFVLREERVYDQTQAISNMTPDVIASWSQNKALSAAGRKQLEQIAAKKREVAANDAAIKAADSSISDLTQDQGRVRSNIQSLNSVAGQQDLVQQYARQLAANETKMAALRDQQSDLKRKKTALESELNTMMETIEF